MSIKKQFYLTFPKKLVDQPILFQVGHKFKVVTNIRGASVSHGVGRVALEMTGEKEQIERSKEWLESKGIVIEEMKEKKSHS
jgi:ABC-type methionine transport system ATPase subunit